MLYYIELSREELMLLLGCLETAPAPLARTLPLLQKLHTQIAKQEDNSEAPDTAAK